MLAEMVDHELTQMLRRLTSLHGSPASNATVALPRATSMRRRAFTCGVLRAASIVGLSVAVTIGSSRYVPAYETSNGERRVVPLADGSTVHLNAASRIRVHLSSIERRVILERGEALFDVVHNEIQPFRVAAATTTAQALGTQFTVSTSNERVQVIVVSGRVAVSDGADLIQAVGGEQVESRAGHLARTSVSNELMKFRTAWATGRIVFVGDTLGRVVEAFNQSNPTRIVIDDPELAQITLGGTLSTPDAETFTQSLEPLGVTVTVENRNGQRVLHLSRAAAQ